MLRGAVRRRVELTPYARAEFEWSYEPAVDDIDDAHKLIVLSFMGQGSDSSTRSCRTGFRSKLSDGRAFPAYEWASWAEAIPAFTERLRGVLIENRDALEVIQRCDSPGTLIYADPPYCHETRTALHGRSAGTHGYRHEMSDDDHRRLAEVLHAVEGMVVLSGYPSELYDRELYPNWDRFERRHMADHGKTRIEVVWLNPAAAEGLRQQDLFGRGVA